jgi:hypothetical protein
MLPATLAITSSVVKFFLRIAFGMVPAETHSEHRHRFELKLVNLQTNLSN